MGFFTPAQRPPLACGYIDDGTPTGRRFVFVLPEDGRPPRTVDLPDPPGSATPGRRRRYRAVGRRHGDVYLYILDEMPGVFPGSPPVAEPDAEEQAEWAETDSGPSDVDVPDGPEPDLRETPSHPSRDPRRHAVCTRAELDLRQAARRRQVARQRERVGLFAVPRRDAEERARRAAERAALRRAAAERTAARRAAARTGALRRAAAQRAALRRAAAQRAALRRAAAQRVASRRAAEAERTGTRHVAAIQRELAAERQRQVAVQQVAPLRANFAAAWAY